MASLIVLIVDALNDNLTVNPIQAATQRTGGAAIILLALVVGLHATQYLCWLERRR